MEIPAATLYFLRWIERMSALAFAAYVMWYAFKCFRASVVESPRRSQNTGTINAKFLGVNISISIPQFAAGIALTLAGLLVPFAVISAKLELFGNKYADPQPTTPPYVSTMVSQDNLDELQNAIDILMKTHPESDAVPPLQRVYGRMSKQAH
jgi:hypothetical protein